MFEIRNIDCIDRVVFNSKALLVFSDELYVTTLLLCMRLNSVEISDGSMILTTIYLVSFLCTHHMHHGTFN